VVLPSKFRDALTRAKELDELYLSPDPDGCISICPKSEWQRRLAQLDAKPFAPEQMRRFRRHLSSMTETAKCDKQGRMLLSARLLEQIQCGRDIYIVGNLSVIEVWPKERRDQRRPDDARDFGKATDELFK
jgi:division/cell wall cluster transcriptional repressor MraZ